MFVQHNYDQTTMAVILFIWVKREQLEGEVEKGGQQWMCGCHFHPSVGAVCKCLRCVATFWALQLRFAIHRRCDAKSIVHASLSSVTNGRNKEISMRKDAHAQYSISFRKWHSLLMKCEVFVSIFALSFLFSILCIRQKNEILHHSCSRFFNLVLQFIRHSG